MTLGTIKLVAGFTMTAVASLAVGFHAGVHAGVRAVGRGMREKIMDGDIYMEIRNEDGSVDTYGTRPGTSDE